MHHRDLISDEIERMGNVLRMIINRFLNLEPGDNVQIAINEANKQFTEQFTIEIDDLLGLELESLRQFVNQNQLTSEHCDEMANILCLLKSNNEIFIEEKRKMHLQTAALFLTIAEQKTDVLSLERMDLKSKIAQQLNN